MSAASTVAAALSGTSLVAIPAATLAVVNSAPAADVLPDQVRAAVWILSGAAFLATVARNLFQLLKAARGLMALTQSADGKPELSVTRNELALLLGRMERLEKRVDKQQDRHREEMRELTKTMNTCLRDMGAAVARIQGNLDQ